MIRSGCYVVIFCFMLLHFVVIIDVVMFMDGLPWNLQHLRARSILSQFGSSDNNYSSKWRYNAFKGVSSPGGGNGKADQLTMTKRVEKLLLEVSVSCDKAAAACASGA